MRRTRILSAGLLGLAFLAASGDSAGAQETRSRRSQAVQALLGTAFTYQSRLTDGGAPATGDYDLAFYLFDSAEGGAQVGSDLLLPNVPIVDGAFTVSLDFGEYCNDTALWLAVSVKPAGTDDFEVLSTRQALTAAPYALHA